MADETKKPEEKKPEPPKAPEPPKGPPTFKIDGAPVEFKPGETILQAGLRAGKFIPHYCYHPGLSISGNCRICLVHSAKSMPPGKPVIACQTTAIDGDDVESDGPRTKAVREGVMEFLLINHPLDCPVCDQAGECDLQQYSFDYGRSGSRFVEAKNQKSNKDFGPLVRFNGNRCIVCTRCVRFCEEVSGTSELYTVNRGDHNAIDTFPGIPLDNPLSGCAVDVCPVGALLDRDFLHKSRVWLLRGTKSVCGHCATGCNVNVEQWNDEVQRVTPRENQAVNKWWMCDEGRLSYKEATAPTRFSEARKKRTASRYDDALEEAAAGIARAVSEGRTIAGVATGHATNEELFALKLLVAGKAGLAAAKDLPLGVVFSKDGPPFKAKDGFEVAADRNPNRAGVAKLIGDGAAGFARVRDLLDKGQAKVVVILGGIPNGAAPWGDLDGLVRRADLVVYLGLGDGQLVDRADVALPSAHWTEKDGTFVNRRGRVQRVRASVAPPGDARPELDALLVFLERAGLIPRATSAASFFKKLAAEPGSPFAGLDYQKLGELGVPLPGAEDTVPPEKATSGYAAGPVSRQKNYALDEQVRPSIHREAAAGYGTEGGVT